MAKIVAFINYKGGVGKTTTAYHIGCSLALHHEKRVLFVDVDPQTNLTFLCAVPERWEEFKNNHGTLASLYRAYLENVPLSVADIVWKAPIQRAGRSILPVVDLIPSDVELLTIDLDLLSRGQSSQDLKQVARFYLEQRLILQKALTNLRDRYDYILIDCPPNLYLVTQNALAASDYYMITALPDHLSTIGMEILTRRVDQLHRELRLAGDLTGQSLQPAQLKGIIFVRVRQGGSRITNLHERTMERVGEAFPGLPFDSYTTEGIGYGEAAEQALPIFVLDDANAKRVAQQYMSITDDWRVTSSRRLAVCPYATLLRPVLPSSLRL